jgi:hypothetical protein
MANKHEVPADKLSWLCDLSLLPFTCTADMTPLVDFIGQERAIRAIQLGLGVDKPGFNYIRYRTYRNRKNQQYKSLSEKDHHGTGSARCRVSRTRGLVLRLQFQ